MRRTLITATVLVWAFLIVIAAISWLVLSRESLDSLFAGFLVATVGLVLVGAILTLKRPSNSVGPLSMIAGSAWVIYLFGNGYGAASLSSPGPALPGAYFFGWMGGWVGALFPIGLAMLILVFPSGKPLGWWRLVLIGPIIGLLSTGIGAVFLWGFPLSTLVSVDLPNQAEGYGFVDAGFIFGFVSTVPASLAVVGRFRAAGFVERQQIKWLLAATVLLAVAFIAVAVSENEAFSWVMALAVAAIPVAILFAITRYRLYEIDRIVSRTVSYALVVGLLAAVFFGAIALSTLVLPDESDLATAASTLVVAGLFNPVRRRVQTWVDRRFNRSRYDAQRVMDRFAGSLRDEMDLDGVVEGWVSVVSRTMQPTSVAVWTKDDLRNDFGTMKG